MSIVETASPALVGYAQETVQQLREAIQHLPSEEKEVFLLRQNGEMTYEQIAQLDNRSVEVVKEQMRSALRKLRTVVQEASSGNQCRPGITDLERDVRARRSEIIELKKTVESQTNEIKRLHKKLVDVQRAK